MAYWIQLGINGLGVGGWAALIAFGLAIVIACTGVFHLAHAGTLLVAAYVATAASDRGVPLVIAIAFSAVIAAVVGVLAELCCYEPLRRRGSSTATVTVASFAIFLGLQAAVQIAMGAQPRALTSPHAAQVVRVGDVVVSHLAIASGSGVVVVLLTTTLVQRTTRAWQWFGAVSADAERAATVGINVRLVRCCAFSAGSAVLAVPATITAIDTGIAPSIGLRGLLFAIAAVAVAGVGSVRGAMATALGIGVVQAVSTHWIPGGWQQSIVFALLVLVMLVRPRGVFGDAGSVRAR